MKINNHKKNHLDLYQVQKCPNVILNALAILLEAFFNIFCQQTDMTALLYPAAHVQVGNNNSLGSCLAVCELCVGTFPNSFGHTVIIY